MRRWKSIRGTGRTTPTDRPPHPPNSRPTKRWKKSTPPPVISLPAPTRLAIEMALHEEQEMRALQGELWRLERAWEEAEEIAGIADNLLLPDSTDEQLDALKSRSDERPDR